MIKIIPAILTNNPPEALDMAKKSVGLVERVQIDIIDGQFAKNKTIDPSVFEEFEENMRFDYHLMTKDPINWIERCIRGGGDRIIGQVEMMQSQADFVQRAQGFGVEAGLAIDLGTPVSKLELEVLNILDVVLVMSVPAGFGGQEFDESVFKKIEELDKIRTKEGITFKIIVDGGVSEENIASLQKLGVNEVAVGRRLFEGDTKVVLEAFQEKAQG